MIPAHRSKRPRSTFHHASEPSSKNCRVLDFDNDDDDGSTQNGDEDDNNGDEDYIDDDNNSGHDKGKVVYKNKNKNI